MNGNFPDSATVNPAVGTAPGDISPIAYGLLNYKLPNGQFLIPSANSFVPTINFPENTFTPGTAYFIADQAVSDLDWIVTSKDTVALKYYYQHDPSIAPYAYSGSPGFTQNLDAGSQVASITNTQIVKPNLSVVEVFGFIREKIYSTIQQPFTPQQFGSYVQGLTGASAADSTINTFGSPFFPGISIVDDYGNSAPYNENFVFNAATNIGSGAASQGALTGVFQNRFMPSANAIWTLGKHTLTFGGNFAYTQLNTRDQRTDKGTVGFADFSQFLQGLVVPYTPDGFITTAYPPGRRQSLLSLQGNRHLSPGQISRSRSNLSLTAGLRFDDHGGLTEKYGRLYNFDPSEYDYNDATDTIVNNGFLIAGNNKLFPSKGVSDSTLTGRQWGLGPRLGVAWSPEMFQQQNRRPRRLGHVLRPRRTLHLSFPGLCCWRDCRWPLRRQSSSSVRQFSGLQRHRHLLRELHSHLRSHSANRRLVLQSLGSDPQPPPTGNPASIVLPNAAAIENGAQLFSFADYNRANKLPYTLNQTLDIQWQPRKDLAITIGYVGNLGRHEIIPVPFNQAGIATSQSSHSRPELHLRLHRSCASRLQSHTQSRGLRLHFHLQRQRRQRRLRTSWVSPMAPP